MQRGRCNKQRHKGKALHLAAEKLPPDRMALEDAHEEERKSINYHKDCRRPDEAPLERAGAEYPEVEGEDGEFGEEEAELVGY